MSPPSNDPDETPVVERSTKQVIVMRTDLNMRKGKMVAQGAHASMAVMLKYGYGLGPRPPAVQAWLDGSFTKVCVGVTSEEQLLEVERQAQRRGIPSARIVDSGRTEFHGAPTLTCLAVGPWWADEIDEVTGTLKLL